MQNKQISGALKNRQADPHAEIETRIVLIVQRAADSYPGEKRCEG